MVAVVPFDSEYKLMGTLNAGLDRLARALADDEARRADLRREAVEALAPILTQILDCLAPAAQSRRLEEALTEELLRLSRAAPPLRASIACGPSLRAMSPRPNPTAFPCRCKAAGSNWNRRAWRATSARC